MSNKPRGRFFYLELPPIDINREDYGWECDEFGVVLHGVVHATKDCEDAGHGLRMFVYRPGERVVSIKIGRGAWVEVYADIQCSRCIPNDVEAV